MAQKTIGLLSVGFKCLQAVMLMFVLQIQTRAQDSTVMNSRRPVSYCEVMEHMHRYDHKVIYVKAIYTSGGEITSFYDPTCTSSTGTSWLEVSKRVKSTTPMSVRASMQNLLGADGRAQVDALVEFYGPKPVKVPVGTSDGLAALMRDTDSKYGDANQFSTKVRLLKVMKVEPVPTSTPWPH
jgi:hypothetical protein